MSRINCIECNKSLRNYSAGKPRVHRSCWLKLRNTSDRHYDFLFCNDKREMKKTEYIKPEILPPINEHNEQDYTFILDIKGNLLKLPKSFIIQENLNHEINELIDNYDLSNVSFPPSPPPSPSAVEH